MRINPTGVIIGKGPFIDREAVLGYMPARKLHSIKEQIEHVCEEIGNHMNTAAKEGSGCIYRSEDART